MKRVYFAAFIFLFSSLVISLLLYLNASYHSLQLAVLALLIVILFLFQLEIDQSRIQSNSFFGYGFLLLFTLFIELLVVSTGGIGSHFLLLAALFTIAISFLLDIPSALIFLLLFFLLLGFQIYDDTAVRAIVISDPATLLLSLLTFIIVGSLAVVLNEYYHFKDVFLEVLKKKVAQKEYHEQSILSDLTELIVITDLDLKIISVNEAVEKAVQLSKSELLKKNIFKTIFLEDAHGHFLSKESISLDHLLETSLQVPNLALITKNGSSSSKYMMVVKPILDLEGHLDQLLFIIRDIGQELHEENSVLDQIITKQQAVIEDIRVKSRKKGLQDLEFKAALIGKIDREMRNIIELKSDSINQDSNLVNIARVSKNTCEVMLSFAQVLHVKLTCKLLNVGNENIEDLVLGDSSLPVDELTRSLYTVRLNLKWFDILLHKLIEIAILLSSSSENARVSVAVERDGQSVTITISSSFANLHSDEINKLFALNYGDLQMRTNLKLASGLEGYIAQQISEKIGLPMTVRVSENGVAFVLTARSTA